LDVKHEGEIDMTDEEKKKGQDVKEEDKQDPAAEPKTTDTDGEKGPIPYERFKEVNDRAKTYETRLAELEKLNTERETEAEKARTDRLKEQEKFQELATEWEGKFNELSPQHDAVVAELKVANEIIGKFADAQMEAVPELYRDIVAKLPLTERLAWLTENSEKLGKTSPKGVPATPAGSGAGDISDEERRKKSARTF
jgi:hypothetical protein